ncbi:MAG: META domain-containing protein [Actinomycetia bacterium]|nr:META domain-containing protein [Actinomycetes bacterium]
MIDITNHHSLFRRWSAPVSLLAVVALFAAACGSSGSRVDAGDSDTPAGEGSGGAEIVGEWTVSLLTADGSPVEIPEEASITLDLDGTQASGRAACNHFGGAYQVDGDRLVFSDLFSTEMGCPEPLAELETMVLGVLTASPRLERADSRLTLTSEGVSLVFEPTPVVETVPLVGTEWVLTGFIEGEVASTHAEVDRAYLVFADDGSLGGNAGCNSLRSTWTSDGNLLSVGELAITRMSCGAHSDEVEGLVLVVLAEAERYEIDGRHLLVWAGDRALDLVARSSEGG